MEELTLGMRALRTDKPLRQQRAWWTRCQHRQKGLGLAFVPQTGVDYAIPFAQAVLAAHDSGLHPDVTESDRSYAERIIAGEGRDLTFGERYIKKIPQQGSGAFRILKGSQRRGAFSHILGIDSADCAEAACNYRGPCKHCKERGEEGYFIGCRHSHEISKQQVCSNCFAAPKLCSSHTAYHAPPETSQGGRKRKKQRPARRVEDTEDELSAEIIVQPRQPSTRSQARPPVQTPPVVMQQATQPPQPTAYQLRSAPLEDGLPVQGPFFSRIVRKTVDSRTRPKVVSRAMRHEMIEQDDDVLQAELLWANHYKFMLESELRSRQTLHPETPIDPRVDSRLVAYSAGSYAS